MELNAETIMINGVNYVKADSKQVTNVEGKKFVIVRTYSAGVFAGFLESRNGQEVILLDARRLWYWKGAASLSQLALDGVKNPDECKFPAAVPRVELLQAIEILDVSEKAKKSIDGVKVWQM